MTQGIDRKQLGNVHRQILDSLREAGPAGTISLSHVQWLERYGPTYRAAALQLERAHIINVTVAPGPSAQEAEITVFLTATGEHWLASLG